MTTRDQEEQDLRIELMQAQKNLADRQFRWETIKGLAAFIGATAVLVGAIIGLANWLRQSNPPPLFPPGTTITIPAPSSGAAR